jgi:hypothetical protein
MDKSLSTLNRIMREEESLLEQQRLTLHMIGIGPDVRHEFVQRMASIGNGSFLNCPTSCDLDRLVLVQAFSRLAAQPATRISLVQHDGASAHVGNSSEVSRYGPTLTSYSRARGMAYREMSKLSECTGMSWAQTLERSECFDANAAIGSEFVR